jgi:hypothetical protein
MATQTTNYGLKKPASTDDYNIQDANGNMDIIDTKLKQLSDSDTAHIADVSHAAGKLYAYKNIGGAL